MKIKNCGNGHFYVGDKCPYCLSDDELTDVPEKYRNLGNFVRLDRGSTCHVYKISSDSPLVLKVIRCGSDKKKYENALNEKNIVDVIGQSDRVISILDFDAAESVDGEKTVYILEKYYTSLESFASLNSFRPMEILKIAIDLCDAVGEIIERGVFHLDLKPKNIFLSDENKIILGDFGSALTADDLSKNKSVRGTLEYMAPEVYQEHRCGEQSEIYSIGLILYYLFNGRRLPFVEDINDTKQRKLAAYKRLAGTELPPISFSEPFLENEINSLIKAACAYKSENRTKSISDLRSGLCDILRQIESSVEAVSINRFDPKKVLPVIFMVDVSENMSGTRICTLNNVMRDALDMLRETARESVDRETGIAVLQYSNRCEWATDGLVGVDDFKWEDVSGGGRTDFGLAIRELDANLSRNALFDGSFGYYTPVIINVTDGNYEDGWEKELEAIKKNKWFNISRKFCITIGSDVNLSALTNFCGTAEGIIRAEDIHAQISIIFAVDVSASMASGFSQKSSETTESLNDGWNEEIWDADNIAYSIAPWLSEDNADDESERGDTWNPDSPANSMIVSADEHDRGEDDAQNCQQLNKHGISGLVNSQSVFGYGEAEEQGGRAGVALTRCRVCGSAIPAGASFCMYCGSNVGGERSAALMPPDKTVIGKPSAKPPQTAFSVVPPKQAEFSAAQGKSAAENSTVRMSSVEFSAIAPKHLVKGEYSIIDIVMYEDSFRHIVDEIRSQSETETQEKKSGKINVQAEANIKVVLNSSDIEIEDNEMTGVWQGSYLDFSFPIFLPEDYSKKQVLFIAKVFINDVIATRLTFAARCSSLFEQKIHITRKDVLTAFISYASQDRKKVAAIVQGMQKARPDMDLFFDVESLRSGENWEKTLYNEIEKRDVLYLCWSHFAKNSEWVDKEWRYAYAQKGIDGIEPIPIELPEYCPPPQELSGKHWNDRLLYLMDHSNNDSSEDDPTGSGAGVWDSWM